MTDTWFIFNKQGQLSFNTQNPIYASTDYLPVEDRPGYVVKNPIGYEPSIDQSITFDITSGMVIITNNQLETPLPDIKDIGSLYDTTSSLDSRLSNTENTANANSNTIISLLDSINTIQNQITDLGTTIQNMNNSINTINTQLQGIEGTLGATLIP
jgi:hypothetical protein